MQKHQRKNINQFFVICRIEKENIEICLSLILRKLAKFLVQLKKSNPEYKYTVVLKVLVGLESPNR